MAVIDREVVCLDLEATLRLAEETDLAKLEWFGQYTHYRRLFRRIYRETLQNRQVMWVADVNGFPIGQIFINLKSDLGLCRDEPHGYLYALRVMLPFRRRGLGARLVERAEMHLLGLGYGRATIAVGKENAGALRLYRRLGYVVVGDDPGRWHYVDHQGMTRYEAEPCWMMEKRLSRKR